MNDPIVNAIDNFTGASFSRLIDRNDDGRLQFGEYSNSILSTFRYWAFAPGVSKAEREKFLSDREAFTPEMLRSEYYAAQGKDAPIPFPNGVEPATDAQFRALSSSVGALAEDIRAGKVKGFGPGEIMSGGAEIAGAMWETAIAPFAAKKGRSRGSER